MRAHDVAVQMLDEEAALLELRLDDIRNRRLAGGGQTREPDDEPTHVSSSFTSSDATVWMPHSVLSVPAQRPARPSPGCVECTSPIEA